MSTRRRRKARISSSLFAASAPNSSRVQCARSDGAAISRCVSLTPATSVSTSSGSARKAGSISGSASGSGLGELHRSAALRLQRADVAGHAAAPAQLARVVLDHRDDEMELDVGLGEIGPRLEEAAGLGEIGRRHAAPLAAIARNRRDERRERAERQAEQVARARGVAEHDVGVVVQIGADARQVDERRDRRARAAPPPRRRPTASAVAASRRRRARRSSRAAPATSRLTPRWRISAPIARLPSNSSRSARACVSTRRLGRLPRCGLR